MTEERVHTVAALAEQSDGWAISWGNEALLLPKSVAESWARRILASTIVQPVPQAGQGKE